MTEIANLTTDLLAWGTILMQIAIVAIVIGFLLKDKAAPYLAKLAPFVMPAIFVLSLAGSILTLVYSEVFGMAPCGYCWLQRVFLYPIAVISGIALIARDTNVGKYIAGLSVPGLLIALYHHYLQVGGVSVLPCPATPGAADCAQRMIFEFGYVTFPLMAATVFALIIVLTLLRKR